MDEKSVMSHNYSLTSKRLLNNEGIYVLNIDVNNIDVNSIAASMSDNSVHVLDMATLKTKAHIQTKISDSITDIKFSTIALNYIYTSSKNGIICKWDLREYAKPALKFDSISENFRKPINSFALDAKEEFLMAGTDLVEEDAYVLFWDCRTAKLLGGYWESHTDDVTQVCFNKHKPNILASGSTDGLINIFDVTQTSEDDALLSTLNTESSVSKLSWLDDQTLSCLTNTEEVQIWDWEEVVCNKKWERSQIKQCLGTDTVQLDYFVDCFSMDKKEVLLASGTHNGLCHIWSITGEPNLWTVLEGHTDTIRCLKRVDRNLIVSGGEDGTVCVWKASNLPNNLKEKSNVKQKLTDHSKKPY